MPTFDFVSEIDRMEVDNALNQARKKLTTRFDFKGAQAEIEEPAKDKSRCTPSTRQKLKALHEIVISNLAKRNVDLRNVDHGTAAGRRVAGKASSAVVSSSVSMLPPEGPRSHQTQACVSSKRAGSMTLRFETLRGLLQSDDFFFRHNWSEGITQVASGVAQGLPRRLRRRTETLFSEI